MRFAKGARLSITARTGRILGKISVVVFAAMLVGLLCACSGIPGVGGQGGAPTGASFSSASTVSMPVTDENPETNIDTSHAADGYIVAHYSNAARLKFQVSKDDMVYNYDLPNDNTPMVFPVNMGDGDYLLRIMKNTDGNNYVEAESQTASIKLSSEFAPFLIPNMYCDYNPDSACVAKARELTTNATNEGEAVKDICTYVVDNISYDTAKARELTSLTGYVPNPDETLASGKGVCFDYASLGAAMLRSQGFPTKIITGYVSPGDLYHAWIMVYADGTWQTGEFSVNPSTWSRVDLTFAASGSTEFTGDGTNYTERYVY